ncbi:hypothetical protein AMK68_03160, partial [candidate division KD3-62 bacterium DG_56]
MSLLEVRDPTGFDEDGFLFLETHQRHRQVLDRGAALLGLVGLARGGDRLGRPHQPPGQIEHVHPKIDQRPPTRLLLDPEPPARYPAAPQPGCLAIIDVAQFARLDEPLQGLGVAAKAVVERDH